MKKLFTILISLILHYAAFMKDIWIFQFICYFMVLSYFIFLMDKEIRSKIKLDSLWLTATQISFSALVLWMVSGSVYFYFFLIQVLCKWYLRITNQSDKNEKLDN